VEFLKELLHPEFVGEITAVALAPNGGVLGEDTCVAVQIEQLSNFSCRHDGKAKEGDHNIVASVKFVNKKDTDMRCNDTIAAFDEDEEGFKVIWEEECMMGFECFEACPAANLSAPPTAQPSTYRMTDFKYNSSALEDGIDPPPVDQWCLQLIVDRETNTSPTDKFAPTDESTYYFSCEGEWADVQVRIRYDVGSLDRRIAAVNYSGNDQPQVGFANVEIKGTVEQVWPEDCQGTLMFVEGTLVGGVSFDPAENQALSRGKEKTTTFAPVIESVGPGVSRKRVLFPEVLITSSAPIGEMQYTVLNASDECYLNVTQTFTHETNGTFNSSEYDPKTNSSRQQTVFSVPALQVRDSDNDNVTDLWSFFRMSWFSEGQDLSQWVSVITGPLREVCGIGTEQSPPVQIQCLSHEPIVVDTVDLSATPPPPPDGETQNIMALTTIDGIDLSTIARIAPTESELKESFNVTEVSPLQVSGEFKEGALDCFPDQIERLRNETQGRGGFVVRSVPLTISVNFTRDGVENRIRLFQDCPVLVICEEAYPFRG